MLINLTSEDLELLKITKKEIEKDASVSDELKNSMIEAIDETIRLEYIFDPDAEEEKNADV